MEFDKSNVYSAANADELKVGSKVIVADTLNVLKNKVEAGGYETTLCGIADDDEEYRFHVASGLGNNLFALAYLIEEPGKLKWTDLKIGDIIKKGKDTAMVIATDLEDPYHILAGNSWLNDDDLKDWEKVNAED